MALPSNNRDHAEINQNWFIKYWYHGDSESHLTSAAQYHKIVGQKTAEKHFKRVLEYERDKYTFKIRNHLKIEFYQK